MGWFINNLIITTVDVKFFNAVPALLFLSVEHHFECFAMKSPQRTEHDG